MKGLIKLELLKLLTGSFNWFVFELEKKQFCRFSFVRPWKDNFGLVVIPYFHVVQPVFSTIYNVTVNEETNLLLSSLLQHSLPNITTFNVILVVRCFR